MAFLRLDKVSFTYPGQEAPAVENVSFSVERGQLVGLCGATGSGKSTLLRLLKRELSQQGERKGRILLDGVPLEDLPAAEAAFAIGYVMQRPDEQIVTDKVWHELSFGLENMGLPRAVIARRVAETAAYFGMESWYEKPVCELSGGQKQLLNLAAVMAMQPKLLLLDEPTAQLDPIAAADFIATVHRLNRELGLTVLVIEHRLEELAPLCHRLLALDKGHLLACDAPSAVAASLGAGHPLLAAMPAAARLYHALGGRGECPMSVAAGRRMVEEYVESAGGREGLRLPAAPEPAPVHGAEPQQKKGTQPPALEMKQVTFRYQKNAPDVLRGASLKVKQGQIVCLLGGNGSGKSTLLGAAAGLRRVQHGHISIFGKKRSAYRGQSLYRECVALLPQDVQTLFLCDTVREELAGVDQTQLPFDLTPLLERHPYDLSGGEAQLVALARVLAQKPRLLLLDEPTKGLDAHAKQQFAMVLQTLRNQGMALLVVTHDVAFAAECADCCALLFRGQVVSQGQPRAFFSENLFYTTAISRMTRGLLPDAVTVEETAALLGMAGKGENPASRKEAAV